MFELQPIEGTPERQLELTVSQVSQYIKKTLEEGIGFVSVRGEISGFKGANSGHLYFSLKDELSVLNCVCFKGAAQKLNIILEDGLEVIVSGRITTYPARSNYQLLVTNIKPAGIGALLALLEKRRKMLEAEGLFDPKNKKNLPFLPQVIGIVTSPTGAVIRDMLHRIKERFPVHVIVWPTLVQGQEAAEQIAAAIKGFNQESNFYPKPNLLIVARGGGSIEDLWAFNEEEVVRAIAESHIPIISAIGHETDTTLSDFAADKRAPTPTAAAEFALPVKADLQHCLKDYEMRYRQALPKIMINLKAKLDKLALRLAAVKHVIHKQELRLKSASLKLKPALMGICNRKELRFRSVSAKLSFTSIVRELTFSQSRLMQSTERARQAISIRLNRDTIKLGHLESMLLSLSYRNTLKRGYAIARDESNKIIDSSGKVSKESKLELEFHDGMVRVKAF